MGPSVDETHLRAIWQLPDFDTMMDHPFSDLAKACCAWSPASRPGFMEILAELTRFNELLHSPQGGEPIVYQGGSATLEVSPTADELPHASVEQPRKTTCWCESLHVADCSLVIQLHLLCDMCAGDGSFGLHSRTRRWSKAI